jgi:hypothetical protein
MTKCDFCTKSLPNGGCYWKGPAREDDCEKAINRMVETLKRTGIKLDVKES